MNRPQSAIPKTVATKPKLLSQNITFVNTTKVSSRHKNESFGAASSQLETTYTGRFKNRIISSVKPSLKNLTAGPEFSEAKLP